MAESTMEAMEFVENVAATDAAAATEHLANLQVDNLKVQKMNVGNVSAFAGGIASMAVANIVTHFAIQGIGRGAQAAKGFFESRKAKRLAKKQAKLEEQQKKLQRENFRAEVEAKAEVEAETSES